MNGNLDRTRFEGTGKDVFHSRRAFEEEHVFPDADFFDPNLNDVTPEVMERLPIAEDLVRDLATHRLLVFGGHELREKSLIARHIAFLLRLDLCYSDRFSEADIRILQWHPSSSPSHLDDVFARYKTTTIFFFPAIQPYHLGYDLRHFLDAVVRHEHYAIVATESVRTEWSQDDWVEASIWRELKTEEIFVEGYLTEVLHYRLKDVEGLLPNDFLPNGLPDEPKATTELTKDLTIGQAASKLNTPNQIRSFVAALCTEDATANAEWVREKLDQLSGSRHAIQRWFRQSSHRDQLLILGLVLFDGLFDDQFFAGLEFLTKFAWRAWDPMLSHFDYHELEKAGAYFNGTKADTKTTRIECSSVADREALFEIGWKLHRRRILATLPLLVKMAGDSTYGPSRGSDNDREVLEKLEKSSETHDEEPEAAKDGIIEEVEKPLSEDETRHSRWQQHGAWRDLFGSPERNVQFRRVISQTLSQLGLLSQDAVERTLLDLAEDERTEVQAVAASAIASWRGISPVEENNRKLFQILAAWQSEARQKEYAQRRRRHGSAEPLAHIRATVALTVSYASLHDRPNELVKPLYRRIESFVTDRSPIVRRRFATHTLPVVVAGHLTQLEELLWEEVLQQSDLLYGTALGMAFAYLLRPKEAQPILDRWHNQARALPDQDLPKGELTRRETALATVAMTYGCIPPGEGKQALTTRQIFRHLLAIASEDHLFVRGAVLLAMIEQARHDLESAAPEMQPLISEVTLEERTFIIEELTKIYLEQRQEQRGSESQLTINGRIYPTWIEEKRPQTAIEGVLFEWVQDSSYPVAQQLAFETLVAFAETALERIEKRREEERNRKEDPDEDTEAETLAPRLRKKRLRPIPVFGHVAVFLAAFAAPEMRVILPPLVPEYLRRESDSVFRRLFELVLQAAKKGKAGWQELLEIETLKKAFAGPDDSSSATTRLLERDSEHGGEQVIRYLRRAAHIYRWRWIISAFTVVVLLLLALIFYFSSGQ